ncbi:MAG: EAL domain-containing protein [Actinomycetota bacterium]|nr:EAL domain-containing protein [Actinomycetota bacterium]
MPRGDQPRAGHRERTGRRARTPFALAAAVMIVAAVCWAVFRHRAEADARERFSGEATAVAAAFETAIGAQQVRIDDLVAFAGAPGFTPTSAELDRYASRAFVDAPGLEAVLIAETEPEAAGVDAGARGDAAAGTGAGNAPGGPDVVYTATRAIVGGNAFEYWYRPGGLWEEQLRRVDGTGAASIVAVDDESLLALLRQVAPAAELVADDDAFVQYVLWTEPLAEGFDRRRRFVTAVMEMHTSLASVVAATGTDLAVSVEVDTPTGPLVVARGPVAVADPGREASFVVGDEPHPWTLHTADVAAPPAGAIDLVLGAGVLVAVLVALWARSHHLSRQQRTMWADQLDDAEARAHRDDLTGALNRFGTMAALERALERSDGDGTHVGVMFVDLNRFKAVNDSFGHAVGDELLRHVARRLRGSLRSEDTFGRLGGDEFVAICNVAEPSEVVGIAEGLLDRMAQPFQLTSGVLETGGAMGVAVGRRPGATAESLLSDADHAMYRSKAVGSRFVVFDETMRSAVTERLEIERDLRRARDQFVLHYQPIVDLTSGETDGVEALLRWDRPGVGLVPPAEFLPVAEEAGLLPGIELWVLDRALAQAAEWNRGRVVPLRVAMNLGRSQLLDISFPDQLRDAMAGHGIDPSLVVVEVPELIALESVEAVRTAVQRIRAVGVAVSADDYGTGHTSLVNLIRSGSLDEIKIDESLVAAMADDAVGVAIVEALGTLARGIGVSLVAEGVETEEQRLTLRRLGVDRAQGVLFARPMPAADLTPHLGGTPAPNADRIAS